MDPGASPSLTDAERQQAADTFNAYAIRLAETYHDVQTSPDPAIPQGEDRESWGSYIYQVGMMTHPGLFRATLGALERPGASLDADRS